MYDELLDAIVATLDLDDQSSTGTVKAHLANLTATWNEFRTAFYKEKALGKSINFSYNSMSQKYMEAIGKLNDLLHENRKNNEPSFNNQFNLPALKLHEFHGKVTEWKSFIAKFDQLVHNKKIDDGIKMEYLKMVIKGDAAKLINHIDPSPYNYEICYDILKKSRDI